MAESSINVTEGSGKRLHTFDRSVGGNTVHDEVVVLGEPYLATYTVPTSAAVSIATVDSHLLQIMAGASKPVYLRRIRVYIASGADSLINLQLRRLSTAGTGGTAITPAPLDTGDSAAGATAQTLPTAKGTESTTLWAGSSFEPGATAANLGGQSSLMLDLDFRSEFGKLVKIPAGAANGLALKNTSAAASGQVWITAEIIEINV